MTGQPWLRRTILTAFVGLIALGVAWELWLAPLRPGAWLLSLKVLPLVLAVPSIRSGRVRAYQWWSMLMLIYLGEGLVRGTSDVGPSRALAWIETGLASTAFLAILIYVRRIRSDPDSAGLAPPPTQN